MRTTNFLLATLKEVPSDAEIVSHQLMLRAGMIRKLASGLYTWLPLGLRVLKKVENIVREEMDKAGALEIIMPAIQPAELWQETGRWDDFGAPLLKFKDRHQRDFCYGPTHEEVVTDVMRKELRSYKQLPVILYQFQNKFRDEARPRSGVMRAREFLMKDAYSFNQDKQSLQQSYDAMYQAYTNIFNRLGLNFRAVLADTGAIGGSNSHEFQILATSGEDTIAISDASDYAANTEMAEALAPQGERAAPKENLQKVVTSHITSINDVMQFLNVPANKILKTLIVKGSEVPLVALVLRGDHDLNEIKAEKLPQIAAPLILATHQEILQQLHCKPGYIGPVGLKIPIIIDRSAALCADFICGANEENYHLTGVNWQRDVPLTTIADIRTVVDGDPSPDGKGALKLVRGIEGGHIFQLGNKYSKAMGVNVLDEQGREITVEMGCYGIGVSRLVAACIEQNNDARGIIWPTPMAPFDIALVPINLAKSAPVRETSEKLYQQLKDAGFSVLFDDRDERPGVMFADMDLIGIPHRLVVSDRNLEEGVVEYKARRTDESVKIKLSNAVTYLKSA